MSRFSGVSSQVGSASAAPMRRSSSRLSALLLAGPRILTEAEVTDRKKPPAPQRSSPSPHRVSFVYVTGVDRVPAPETLALVSPADIGTSHVLGRWVSPPHSRSPHPAA
ncbi:MAG TPA: hypothetical protein VGP70_01405 [Actinomadura sp.]|nr:hypothetical protein [Actinomadura sp.]